MYVASEASKSEFSQKLSIGIADTAFYSPGAALHQLFRAISDIIWTDLVLAALARQKSTCNYQHPCMPS
jgi:hypothetical protein